MIQLLHLKINVRSLIAVPGRYYASDYFFISTPIFYVNGAPHIGHMQSCVYADALARAHSLLGKRTVFSTGTDEHGLKVQQASIAAKKHPLEYCTEMSSKFKKIFTEGDIAFTHFIRTTDENHKEVVQSFWRKLKDNGHITKGRYEGWYSVVEESFVPASQVKELKEGSKITVVSSETGSPVEKMLEENYVFPLSKFENDILHWLSQDVINPAIFVEDLKRWIGEGLSDLSISRPRSRLSWGVPVPEDESQIIYVWLDALVNYLTVAHCNEKDIIWPADCHVIGKDILKFHAIYWPAFLIAAGYEPPKQIFCHSHWTVNYEKMSKSKGNVIDPIMLMNKYTCDGFRYFLLKASVPHSDTNYSEVKIHRMLNAELADTLGNLLNRTCAHALNPKQMFPHFSHEAFQKLTESNVQHLIEETSILPEKVKQHFLEGYFYRGLDCIMACLRDTNAFMQFNKPWELAKHTDEESKEKLATILHIALEVLRISGILLQPVIPTLSSSLLTRLGVPVDKRGWHNLQCFQSYHNLHNPLVGQSLTPSSIPLFERRKQ